MGWNTAIMVCNDSLHVIKDDVNFGKKLAGACGYLNGAAFYPDRYLSVTASDGRNIHCNAARVISHDHADDTQLIAVGHNTGRYLGSIGHMPDIEDDDDVVKAMKWFLRRRGYYIRKAPKK